MSSVAQPESYDAPDVSVVILNWNNRDFLHQSLSSLYKETTLIRFECIVVDNGSTDGSVSFVQREWPSVRLVSSPVNVGFARANNLGFRECRGRYILVLNNDTIVLPSTLRGMVHFLDTHPETGCVGCRHLNPDRTLQRSVGHFPSLLEDFLAYTELHRLAILQPFLHRRFAYWGDYDHVREVDWVNGACMMVRREVLEAVGGLDEDYFIYAEELDWCYRIRKAGWRVHYIPDAEIVHFGGQTMNSLPDQRIVLKITSQYRFYYKFYPLWRRLVWRAMVALVALARIGLLVLLLPIVSLQLRRNKGHKSWELLTRERIVTQPARVIQAWWRLLVFATVKPRTTGISLRSAPPGSSREPASTSSASREVAPRAD